MATPMTPEQFVRQLNTWGVKFVEAPGWRTRTRTGVSRPWGPVHGILLHHTGDDAPDAADVKVLTNGRSDLPGPLCHWGMRDDGVAVLIGWGRTNHAGIGAAAVLQAITTEDYGDRPPPPGADSVDGNAALYGQETCYGGSAAPTTVAYRATVRIFAAVCHWHGWSAKSCIGHKEWTARKIDPGHLDMAAFRRDVDALLAAGPAATPSTTAAPSTPQTTTASPAQEVLMRVVRVSDGRMFIVAGPLSAHIPTADLARVWCGLTGQIDAKGGMTIPNVPSALIAGTLDIRTVALIQALAGQASDAAKAAAQAVAAAGQPDVDTAALAAALAPLLPTVVTAWSDEQIAELASAVTDEQARRLAAR